MKNQPKGGPSKPDETITKMTSRQLPHPQSEWSLLTNVQHAKLQPRCRAVSVAVSAFMTSRSIAKTAHRLGHRSDQSDIKSQRVRFGSGLSATTPFS